MYLKKTVISIISFVLLLSVVGCNNKKVEPQKEIPKAQEHASLDKDYIDKYSGFYSDNIEGLKKYQMYESIEATNEYYTTNKYPGNEGYLNEIKAAYKDTKEKMQSFINSLKNDINTDDKAIKKMNDDLIVEGEKTIANIDTKLKELDKLPKESINKPQEEFIKLVNDASNLKEEGKTKLNDLLREMNKSLGIKDGK